MIWFLQNEIQKIQNNPVNIAIVCTSACVALILTSILSALASASASPKYEFPQTFSKTSTTIQKSESYPLRRREYGFVFCFKHTFNFFFRMQSNKPKAKIWRRKNRWCLSFTIVQVHERWLHCQPDSFHGRWCSWGCWSEPHSLSKIFFPLTIIFSNNMMFPPPSAHPCPESNFHPVGNVHWGNFWISWIIPFPLHEVCFKNFWISWIISDCWFIYSGVRIGGTCCGKGVLS